MRARGAAALVAVTLAAGAAPAAAAQSAERWVGTWGLSPHARAPGAADQTVRMIVRTTVGGDAVRIRLSNANGAGAVTFGAASVAVRDEGAAVRAPVVPLTFGGERTVTVPDDGEVTSDRVPFGVPAGTDIAVSLHVSAAPVATAHTSARKTSFLTAPGAGDHTLDTSGGAFVQTTTSALFLSEVQVETPAAGTIVGLGSSSVDGTGTRTDMDERWSDFMARRLLQRPACAQYGYVNAGVDANRYEAMRARIPRDVLGSANVRYVILYAGSGNDIATGDSAEEAIAQTEAIIGDLHAHGIAVVGGTLIPREQATLPGQEAERQEYNHWVRTGGAFDAVIDFEAPVRDPSRPDRYRPGFSPDGIHAGPEGNRLQGEAIDLGIFEPACPVRVRPRVHARVSLRRRVLKTGGRLLMPQGTSRELGCGAGRVRVTVKARRRTLLRRRPALRRNCTFAARTRLRGRHVRGNRRITIRTRFLGNDVLLPARSKPRRVRVPRRYRSSTSERSPRGR